MPRRGGIYGLPGGPPIGQQEGPVHGQPLGRGDGQRIAVIETDIVLVVADLVVTEPHTAPVIGARRDQNRRRFGFWVRRGRRARTFRARSFPAPGPAAQNLEVFHRDHGAVEQLLLPLRRADAQPVADGDLQGLPHPPIHVPADLDDGAFDIRPSPKNALPHQVRQRPRLRPGARKDDCRLPRLGAHVALPVVHQPGQGLLLVMADMEPPPLPPCLDAPPRRRRAAPPTPPPATA